MKPAQELEIGLECAWPGIPEPRAAEPFRKRTSMGLRLVTFVICVLAGLQYGEGVSERRQQDRGGERATRG